MDLDDYELLDTIDTVEIWNGYFVPPDGIYTDSNAMNQNYDAVHPVGVIAVLVAVSGNPPFSVAVEELDQAGIRQIEGLQR